MDDTEKVCDALAAAEQRANESAAKERVLRDEVNGVINEMIEDEQVPRKAGDNEAEIINYYRRLLQDALTAHVTQPDEQ